MYTHAHLIPEHFLIRKKNNVERLRASSTLSTEILTAYFLKNLLFWCKRLAQYYNSTRWYFNVLLALTEAVTCTLNSKHASDFAGVTDDAILL